MNGFATVCWPRPSPCEGRPVYLKHILRCIGRIEESTAAGHASFFYYLGVDLELVYRAVDQDVPKLKLACEAALSALEHPK